MQPTGRKTITVHKEGEEGSLEVDFDTGIITTEVDHRPEWAEGLSTALLTERTQFYEQKLGPKYSEEHARPSGIAYQDLGWIGAGEDGELMEVSADRDYRMQIVADVLGIDREATGDADADDRKLGQTIAEVEIETTGQHYTKSDAELLLDENMKRTFGGGEAQADEQRKTGTGE